jgi:hypothetical protein
MEKLKELIEEEIKKVEENGIEVDKLGQLGMLIDIHKDISNEEYWKKEEEKAMRYGNYGEYGEGYGEGYGRRSRDSRGRYRGYSEGGYSRGMYGERGTTDGRDRSRGSYGHHMPYSPMYMDRMMDGMEGYMEGMEQYSRGNYGAKGQTVESLEKMLEGIVAFVEDIQQDPEQQEEKEVVNHYIRKLKEM